MSEIIFTGLCSDHTEHICKSGDVYLHHADMRRPFSDETTEHAVGECDGCAEWASKGARP